MLTILQAISHLPVSVVAAVAPDLATDRETELLQALSPSTVAALNETLAVLERTRELVNEENFPKQEQVIIDTQQNLMYTK